MTSTKPLLILLTTLADTNEPCPTNEALALTLGRGRTWVVRRLKKLTLSNEIATVGYGCNRVITITDTGLSTKPSDANRRPRTDPAHRIAPPCAVCGDPVVMKSNKFPRSCDKRSCRASIRVLAYGGSIDSLPWPEHGEPIETDFNPYNLTFRPDVRRTEGRPLTTSYGVSNITYARSASE